MTKYTIDNYHFPWWKNNYGYAYVHLQPLFAQKILFIKELEMWLSQAGTNDIGNSALISNSRFPSGTLSCGNTRPEIYHPWAFATVITQDRIQFRLFTGVSRIHNRLNAVITRHTPIKHKPASRDVHYVIVCNGLARSAYANVLR